MNPVLDRIDLLALDLGRLQLRTDVPSWIIDRLAGHVAALDTMLRPTAAELARDFTLICSDADLAIDEALAVVDSRANHLRHLLGKEAQP